MTGDLYYCASCDLVYEAEDTLEYYSPEWPTYGGARACPVDGDKLALVGDADLSVVDYLARVE